MLVLDSSRTKQDFINRKGKSSSRTLEVIQMEMKHFEKFCLSRYEMSLESLVNELISSQNSQEKAENLIQTYIDHLESENKQYSTVQNYSCLAKNYLKFRRVKFDKSELQDNLSFKPQMKEELYPITKQDIQTLLDHADFKQRAKILIQLSGGFRISELLGLRKCDFNTDLERYTAYIRPKYAKNSIARTTIISIEAMKYVDQLIQNLNDTDLLFPHNEKNIKFACVSEMNIFGRLRERAKLNMVYEGKKTHKITTHSLRAFFITQFEKTSSGFGHALSGQSRYLKQYERFTLADKLEKYIETEKYLLIYSNIESEQKMKRELLELQAKVSRLEQLQHKINK